MKPPPPHAKLRASVARRANQRDTGTESLHYDAEPEPNMRLSRAIAVVLILHIVAIGGVLAFSLIKDRTPQPSAKSKTAAKDAAPPPANAPAAKPTTGNAASTIVAATGLIPAAAAKRPEPSVPTENPTVPMPANTAVTSSAPIPPAIPTKPMVGKTIVYTVQAGDTLARVASQHGVSLGALIAVNEARVTTTNLKPGQEIQIPLIATPKDEAARLIETGAPATANQGAPPIPTKISAPAPASANPPAPAPIPATISAKPTNSLPPPPAKELTHTKASTPPPSMAKSTTPTLKPAKVEKPEPRVEKALPVNPPTTSSNNNAVESAPPPASWEQSTYVVAPGDTPANVSRRFGVTENALMKANGLADGQKLPIGQRIVIPSRKPKHW